jgi:F-type H+-transporting ATPase subunit a
MKSNLLNVISISSPLDQFEIRNFLSLDAPILADLHLSLTNIGLYLTIAALTILAISVLATNYNKVIADS